ncbi:LuxR C-terminal-related transcriptional regulator [Acrocarpospora macrocephala]|uniref:Helix-turn-helix transcriptional regulator n=1 Tax=Acrocarpospora macrocephala TaxID=150177 RepID=A0A5M3WVJ2_9ACTN|nr:helix-turn-helix transcriptional regulator [Acrocarpospora macrocephala]GES12009.1 helix-turn-helix transcriptional regulator [Acrocarpospora macrocephala]
MATSIAHERVRERIVRLCRGAAQARELRAAVLDQLRHVIEFDSYVFALTDPRTCVGCDPLADVPLLDELPRLIKLKYVTAVNRWTRLGEPPVALLYEGTGGRREQSLLWRDMLGPAGIVDVASMVFRDRFGCWGFLDLWRATPATPFTSADADFLTTVAPPVTEALRHCQAATFTARPADTEPRTPLVLLLSPELTIRAQTRQTHDYLRRLLPTPAERSPVPAAAYNVAAQLVALEEGVDDHPPAAGVHLAQGVWVTLRAARIGDSGAERSGDVTVTIEYATPAERLDIFSRAFALSAREGELLQVLAHGADTRQAAAQLHLSQHTVQDHLKSIFLKTGTRSRRELFARVLG